jgi:lipoprotein-anchoring transpeptidase ErfK/SrfK
VSRSGDAWLQPHDRQSRLARTITVALVAIVGASLALAAVGPGWANHAQATEPAGHSYATLLVPSGQSGQLSHVGGRVTGTRTVIVSGEQRGSSSGSAGAPASYSVQGRDVAQSNRVAPSRDAALAPYRTVLAHLKGSTPGYPGPDALQSNRKVPGAWYGYPSVLPVLAAQNGRIKVRLAQRPDESTSWIDETAAVYSTTTYAIVIDIRQHWLYVFKNGIQTDSYPVGVGKSSTPTPTGSYFVAFHSPPNSGADYGSVMLETSAHSKVISHFEGGNDAIIAIHGPIDPQSNAEIGNHGAAISNGCIRMHDADLNRVKHVPDGTPVMITG